MEGGDDTKDGTVDLKGNPVLRSKRGGWRACYFVVVYEVFERMAYYGITSNLILYLTKELRQGTVTAANNVTNWVGTIWLTPILGAYVADAHLGPYRMFVISSAIYLCDLLSKYLGMIFLTLAVSVPGLKPPQCSDLNPAQCEKALILQLSIFYGTLYMIAIGTGEPNISTIGADQFDEFDPKEKKHKLSFFNWWMFSIFFGALFASTILVYIQDNAGWALGYGLPAAGVAVSIFIFLAETPFYRHRKPNGSPFTRMAKVIVASMRKWNVPIPCGLKELYELDLEVYTKEGKCRIHSTPSMRFFTRACVKTNSSEPWHLCSVTQVEETKQMLRMLPILIATFVPSIMLAQVGTLFVKQGSSLRRNIGKFEIPPASLAGFVTLSMLVCVVLYDRYLVKIMRRWTKNPRGITLLQRMGVGLILHIYIMLIASFTERYRLKVAKDHGGLETGAQVPLTILVILPQFILMGVADCFLEIAKIKFFYNQAPEGMKSLGTSYCTSSIGIGNFLSSFLLSTVSRITKKHGHRGWILDNLNVSHLDYYYAFFAILILLNFFFFLFVVKYYVYKAEVSASMEILKQELGGTKNIAAWQE